MTDLSLLNPEWQGCGTSTAVHRGALAIARTLFAGADFARVDVPPDEILQTTESVLGLDSIVPRHLRAREELRARAPDRVFHLGGTCGAELAPVGYLNERYAGDLTVVWLDAHADLNTPSSSPSGHFHGMVLRTLLGDGPASLVRAPGQPLAASQVLLAGVRDLDPPEAEFIAEARIDTITVAQCSDPGALAARLNARGAQRVYIHLDLDILDPAAFPDVLVPAPGGLGLAAAAAIVARVNDAVDVVGFGVVEFCERSPDGMSRLEALLRDCGVTIGAMGLLRENFKRRT